MERRREERRGKQCSRWQQPKSPISIQSACKGRVAPAKGERKRRAKRRKREGKISEAKVDRVKWESSRKRTKNEEEKVIAVSGVQK